MTAPSMRYAIQNCKNQKVGCVDNLNDLSIFFLFEKETDPFISLSTNRTILENDLIPMSVPFRTVRTGVTPPPPSNAFVLLLGAPHTLFL